MPPIDAGAAAPPASSLAQALAHAAAGTQGLRIFNGQGELETQASYRELLLQARARATQLRGLARRGPVPTVVGLIAQTHWPFLVNFMACQWAGMLPCPLPPPSGGQGIGPYARRIRAMLAAVQASALLLDDLHSPLQSHFSALETPETTELPVVPVCALPPADETAALQPLQPDEGAYIQFSSGTTSAPKGIEISQRAICNNLNSILHGGLRIHAGDRAFSWLPLYHDMGLVGFFLAPDMGGVPLDLLPAQAFARRPQLWPRLMAQLQSTVCFAPSFAWRLAADRTAPHEAAELQLRLRVAGVGGDVVRTDDLNRFAARFAASGFAPGQFQPSYGLAEATLAVCMGPVHVDEEGRLACGRPLPGWQVRVVDDSGASVPALQTGRIQIQGNALMTGYWQCGQRQPVAPGDWFQTDDLGYLARSGALVVTGRRQSLLVLRGRNVQAEAIETAVGAALQLPHGTVMAFQDATAASSASSASVLTVLVECALQDEAMREQCRSIARKAVFIACGNAADVRLVPPRTVKLTTSGKVARRSTIDQLARAHD